MIENENRLDFAFKFMKSFHGIQERKTGGYYFEHPRRVASLVVRFKDSYKIEDLMIIALLHDIIEDTPCTYQLLREYFGDMIANTVQELTTDKKIAGDSVTKKEYLALKMTQMSSYALVVKLCDRLDNVSDLADTSKEFRDRYIDETIYILDQVDKNRIIKSITHHRLIHEIRNTLSKYDVEDNKKEK